MEKPLRGQSAWITGSSRGVGRVIAGHLAGLGAQVAVHGTGPLSTRAFGEAESLQAVADAISREQGVETLAVWGDLSDEAVVSECARHIRERVGQINVLVNCAGGDIGAAGARGKNHGKAEGNGALNIPLVDLRSILDNNLMTCILACREIAPEMMARRSGSIVNIGSLAGLAGRGFMATYCTAKAAVHMYSRCLADQLRPYNVRVNVVAPGPTITARFEATSPVDEALKVETGTLDRYGWPVEGARAVGFFATDESSFTTGQVLRVAGGKQLFAG